MSTTEQQLDRAAQQLIPLLTRISDVEYAIRQLRCQHPKCPQTAVYEATLILQGPRKVVVNVCQKHGGQLALKTADHTLLWDSVPVTHLDLVRRERNG
ncbi:MAG: hypothetical protein WC977_09090 [Anaerovoracaceae bacterium]|jgi:hypothetical protein